jgi:hypothetical protein
MPIYQIEQYELHTQKYNVQAKSEAEAIAKLLNGEAEAVEGSLEFIEVAEDMGLPADKYLDLADALQKLDVSVNEVIPSIRSIAKVEDLLIIPKLLGSHRRYSRIDCMWVWTLRLLPLRNTGIRQYRVVVLRLFPLLPHNGRTFDA